MKKRIREKLRIIPADELEKRHDTNPHAAISGSCGRVPRIRLQSSSIDQLSTHDDLKSVDKELLQSISYTEEDGFGQDSWDIVNADTKKMPAIPNTQVTDMTGNSQRNHVSVVEDHVSVLRKLVKSSGIYALASVASPLISLLLAPFLTHNLSPSDYGILTITNTAIALTAGIAQLGLASAFFRAYSYDFTSQQDRRDVLATVTTLLCLTSMPIAIMVAMVASTLANLLFGQSTLGNYVILAGGVVLLQNLTVPGMAWLRAEGRPLFYSLLSIGNLLVTLLATICLLGVLHWGVSGAIIANGAGYASIVICTLPIIVLRAGIKLRVDIAKSLLAFGLPLVLNLISLWVLQLSDRYLLGRLISLAETAKYAVAYSLGSAISVLVIGPFGLAWPATLFTIAKREDAVRVFKLVFRWFSIFLLFAAFGLSLIGMAFLDWLFPIAYHSASFVIPIVAESIVFYGIYNVFIVGVNIKRKTWFVSIFSTIAAITNVIFNLILIPRYAAGGAAVSTLLAYAVLAVIAYMVNQKLYPVPFEIGTFILALLVGMILFIASGFLTQAAETYKAWGIYIGAFVLYSGFLMLLVKLPDWNHKRKY